MVDHSPQPDQRGMTGGGLTHGAVDGILGAYGLDRPAHREAAYEAYEAVRNGSAAFIVSIAAQMLPDLRDDIATRPGCRIMFLGRDGHSLAVATHGLDPLFFTAHCHDVVLSRTVADAAIQDLEVNTGPSYPAIDGYRQTEGRHHQQAVLALARRRVDVLWALLRDDRCFQPDPPTKDS